MQIRNIWKGFEAFECKFKPFEKDSKHSKVIQSIQMQIRTISNNSKHSKVILSILMQILTFWKEFEAFKCKF